MSRVTAEFNVDGLSWANLLEKLGAIWLSLYVLLLDVTLTC